MSRGRGWGGRYGSGHGGSGGHHRRGGWGHGWYGYRPYPYIVETPIYLKSPTVYRVCLVHAPPSHDIDCYAGNGQWSGSEMGAWVPLEEARAALLWILLPQPSWSVMDQIKPGAKVRLERMNPGYRPTIVCLYERVLLATNQKIWQQQYCAPEVGFGADDVPGRPTGFPPEPGLRPVPQTDVNLQGASTWWSTRSSGEKVAVAVGGTLLGVVLLRAIL